MAEWPIFSFVILRNQFLRVWMPSQETLKPQGTFAFLHNAFLGIPVRMLTEPVIQGRHPNAQDLAQKERESNLLAINK